MKAEIKKNVDQAVQDSMRIDNENQMIELSINDSKSSDDSEKFQINKTHIENIKLEREHLSNGYEGRSTETMSELNVTDVESVTSRSTKTPVNPILAELKHAFPNIEDKYIRAVIIASQGVLNPAFNALLYLSDPDYAKETPLPTEQIGTAISTNQILQEQQQHLSQLKRDEEFAKQLDEHYNRKHNLAKQPTNLHDDQQIYGKQNFGRKPGRTESELYEDSDFIDFFNRGIHETQKKVTRWWDTVKKNFAEEKERIGSASINQNKVPDARKRRFNSFGAQYDNDTANVCDTKVDALGKIFIHDNASEDDNDEIPPKLPTRVLHPQESDNLNKYPWRPPPRDLANANPTKDNGTPDTGKNCSTKTNTNLDNQL